MPKEKKPIDKYKLRNFRDIIRDEVYGASIPEHGVSEIDGNAVIVIKTKHVAKIAKRIARRWMIGPR